MNREILFRGMTKNGIFVYGDLVKCNFNGKYSLGIKETITQVNSKQPDLIPVEIKDMTGGQSTSYSDNKGKTIYEGDVINTGRFYDLQKKEPAYFEIVFIDGCFKQKDKNGLIYELGGADPVSIVGNIHEHKHLIRG